MVSNCYSFDALLADAGSCNHVKQRGKAHPSKVSVARRKVKEEEEMVLVLSSLFFYSYVNLKQDDVRPFRPFTNKAFYIANTPEQ